MAQFPVSHFYEDIDASKKGVRTANYIQNASGLWVPQTQDVKVINDTNNPLPTQLSGSIVLYGRELGRPLSAGSKSYLFVRNDGLHDFKKVIVAVSADINHTYRVAISFTVLERGVGADTPFYEIFREKFEVSETKSRVTLEPLPILGDRIRVRVFNDDTIDHYYDVHVWGVK